DDRATDGAASHRDKRSANRLATFLAARRRRALATNVTNPVGSKKNNRPTRTAQPAAARKQVPDVAACKGEPLPTSCATWNGSVKNKPACARRPSKSPNSWKH